MSFFDLFKKKKEEVIENKKISWNEFDSWLESKQKEIEKDENDFFIGLKERIDSFVLEINNQISILEKVDINDRKVEERVKYIVKENLRNYIIYLERFIEQLKKINEGKNFIKRFNFIFSDFENKSKINFTKANFLIGKEMEETKDILRKFLKDIEKIMKENKGVITREKIQFIENKDLEIKHIENAKFEILKAIKEDYVKISNLNANIKTKEKEIIDLKNSKEFLDNEKTKKELQEKQKLLERNIDKLKEMINFKALTNFYHSFGKEMALVKECKENFKQIFKRSKENKFIILMDGAKLLKENISKEIKRIDEKKKEIENIVIKDIGDNNISGEIGKMKFEIGYVNSDKNVKEKKLHQLDNEFDEIKKDIKIKLKEINIELE